MKTSKLCMQRELKMKPAGVLVHASETSSEPCVPAIVGCVHLALRSFPSLIFHWADKLS